MPPSISSRFPRVRASIEGIAGLHPLLVLLPILPVYAAIPVVLGPGGQLADEPVPLGTRTRPRARPLRRGPPVGPGSRTVPGFP